MKLLPLLLSAPWAAQAAAIGKWSKAPFNGSSYRGSNKISDKRQFGGLGSLLSSATSLFTTNMKAAKTAEGTSSMKRQGVKNIRLYHGPLKLLPAEEV